jgi:glucosylceramidase
MKTLLLALTAVLAGAANAAPVRAFLTTVDQQNLLAPGPVGKPAAAGAVIRVDPRRQHQRIAGFGAAITEASAWLIRNGLQDAQRDALMRELFTREGNGIGFELTRLTIGASDFSRRHYSLDDMPPGQADPELQHFSLDPERADVIPATRQALALNPKLQVMASPWSAPGWMKTTDSLVQGQLRPEFYGAFARYMVRYVDEMKAEGIPIFALTLQNEPHFEPGDYPGMRMTPRTRATVVGQHLGPLLKRRGLQTQILEWDHNWDEPWSPLSMLSDPTARQYVSGVAWHCYAGAVAGGAALPGAGCLVHRMLGRRMEAAMGRDAALADAQPHHRQHAPRCTRRADVERRAGPAARPAPGRLQGLPRRRHHRA